jgi:hypothetical protein
MYDVKQQGLNLKTTSNPQQKILQMFFFCMTSKIVRALNTLNSEQGMTVPEDD